MKDTRKCYGCNLFFLSGCVDEKASLLCEDSFSVFNGFKYLKVFQLVIDFFSSGWISDNIDSILQKSSLNINNRSGCSTQTAFLPVIPIHTVSKWPLEVRNPADWFMDVISGKVDNAAEPGLKSTALAQKWWHGLTNRWVVFTRPCAVLEDVSLHQLLPLKKEGICLTNVVLLLFLVERKNAIVSRKQM